MLQNFSPSSEKKLKGCSESRKWKRFPTNASVNLTESPEEGVRRAGSGERGGRGRISIPRPASSRAVCHSRMELSVRFVFRRSSAARLPARLLGNGIELNFIPCEQRSYVIGAVLFLFEFIPSTAVRLFATQNAAAPKLLLRLQLLREDPGDCTGSIIPI